MARKHAGASPGKGSVLTLKPEARAQLFPDLAREETLPAAKPAKKPQHAKTIPPDLFQGDGDDPPKPRRKRSSKQAAPPMKQFFFVWFDGPADAADDDETGELNFRRVAIDELADRVSRVLAIPPASRALFGDALRKWAETAEDGHVLSQLDGHDALVFCLGDTPSIRVLEKVTKVTFETLSSAECAAAADAEFVDDDDDIDYF